MKKHFAISTCFIFVCCASVFNLHAEESCAKPQWEYKVVGANLSFKNKNEKKFNELGKEGWELAIAAGQQNTVVFKRKICR